MRTAGQRDLDLGYFADCDDHEEEVLLPLCSDRHLQPLRAGRRVEEVEDKDLARELFEKIRDDQGIEPGTLTVHSDNGPQMRSDAMNEFYAIAGISKSRSRPRVSNYNPYSEALFKNSQVCAAVSRVIRNNRRCSTLVYFFLAMTTTSTTTRALAYSRRPACTAERPSRSSKPANACLTVPSTRTLSGSAEADPLPQCRSLPGSITQPTPTRRRPPLSN